MKVTGSHVHRKSNNILEMVILLQLQPFYGSLDFVRDNLVEPVPEETFTHKW